MAEYLFIPFNPPDAEIRHYPTDKAALAAFKKYGSPALSYLLRRDGDDYTPIAEMTDGDPTIFFEVLR